MDCLPLLLDIESYNARAGPTGAFIPPGSPKFTRVLYTFTLHIE